MKSAADPTHIADGPFGRVSQSSALAQLVRAFEVPMYERFVPPEIADRLDPVFYPNFRSEVESFHSMDVESLRCAMARAFRNDMSWVYAVAKIWELNCEFTRRGVGPAWRGIPELDLVGTVSRPAQTAGLQRLSSKQKLASLKRWIDLEWIRSVLGPTHQTRLMRLQPLFDLNPSRALVGYMRATAFQSTGGGKFGPMPNYKTLYQLAVPKLLRLTLVGLVDRDHGALRTNAMKRMNKTVRPRLEQLTTRPKHAIKPMELARRLQVAEALEIAGGSASDAAVLFSWMTGESITKQSMHAHKVKIAEQCDLNTRAWR